MKALDTLTRRIMLVALFMSCAVLARLPGHAQAALFENYQTSNGVDAGIYGPSVWIAQTFTASSNHTIKYVQLYGKRDTSLTTGTVTVVIKATDGNGKPTGPDLAAASEVVTTIPYNYGWFTIYLPTCAVSIGTRYAIVVSISNASSGAGFWWTGDTVKGYPNGAGLDSTDGGATWMDGGMDRMFNVFGDATAATVRTAAPTADSYPGFDDWGSPWNAYDNGGGYARAGKNITHYYQNFNFSIPAGATINGIEVRLDAWQYASGWAPGATGNFRVWLSWNNGTSLTSYASTANVSASEAIYFAGGPSSTWGRTWSPADFANNNFKIQLMAWTSASAATYPSQALSLDYCQVTVYYTPAPPAAPTVTTATVTGITADAATGGGTITFDGGAAVTARGVCWGAAANPTTADSCTSDGAGSGSFVSAITGLTPATSYHVRAFATNAIGTAYGEDRGFATNAPLSLMLQGTGSGVVHSDPPDVNCSSGTCTQSYPYNANITLTPTSVGHTLFQGWSGDCTNTGGDCYLLMNRSHTVLATFDINPAEAVWVDPGDLYYDSLGSAYQAAAMSGCLIKACHVDFPGDIVFGMGKVITLKGGYGSDYQTTSGYTGVVGTVTIATGVLTFENIAVK